MLTFGYKSQIHRIMICTLFELLLSKPPKSFLMYSDLKGISAELRRLYLHRWMVWPSHLVDNAWAHMLREKKNRQRQFNKKAGSS